MTAATRGALGSRYLPILTVLVWIAGGGAHADEMKYGVASWPEEFGNHRVHIAVAQKAEAVRVHIPWRLRDAGLEKKNVRVVNSATGKEIRNLVRVEVNREFGDLVFEPDTAPGEYDVYTMPYTASTAPHAYSTTYTPPQPTADAEWLDRGGLTPARLSEGTWRNLPEALVLEIQARGERHRFDPMEVIATAEETRQLLAKHAGRCYLLFPEDREHAIRMTDDLPLRWIQRGPGNSFEGQAKRGEFYVFQIGVFAAAKPIEDIGVAFGDLQDESGASIPAAALRCFNVGGTDWLGRSMSKTCPVGQGKVQALWFGVQVPKDAAKGTYRGSLTIRPKGDDPTVVGLSLVVSHEVLEDAGDGDPRRLSRLRWLDSKIGVDDEVVAPYTPLKVDGRTVECLGRRVRFGETGLPASIVSLYSPSVDRIEGNGRELLARPMELVVEADGGNVAWAGGKPEVVTQAAGTVVWESRSTGGALAIGCRTKMEFDGYLNIRLAVKAEAAVNVKDIRLEIPLRREAATYMMGMGRKGGYRPAEWTWTWDVARANNSLWIGDVNGGLQCKLKGTSDTWDLYNLVSSGIPKAWGNDGKGGCTVTEQGTDAVVVRAYSGARALAAGEELTFCFGLLITPVKPLDPAHWGHRYYHACVPVETAAKVGATIINIHHGNDLNPNINYPFPAADRLAAYVKDAHAKGIKVKIYYTVRELSNFVAEMWALRSLGGEIFTDGPGGGHSWLHEHLVGRYSPAWHHTLDDGAVDAAIGTTGLSRWHNYYLEGLSWLVKNVQIDGLYLDGIGYDREIMKRVRKVMDRQRPGCLIDFHSGNNFEPQYGLSNCANQYMEHFPYVNSLWFGEGYNYDESPDYWLVEVSGIPFGLFGEMLQNNGNPWRGMVYGMTARYYSGADPQHVWRFWDQFGIRDAQMIGYWEPSCPVKTDVKDIPATVYRKKGKVLVSLASWAPKAVECRLNIDWTALGLNAEKASVFAPAIAGYQTAGLWRPSDSIPVTPGHGWLLLLDEEEHEVP